MFEKEAEDFVMGVKAKEAIQKQIPYFDFAQKMYLAGVESREKRITELEKENAELQDKLESAEEMIEEIVANKAVIKVYNPYTDEVTIKSLEIALNHWLQRAEAFLQ